MAMISSTQHSTLGRETLVTPLEADTNAIVHKMTSEKVIKTSAGTTITRITTIGAKETVATETKVLA